MADKNSGYSPTEANIAKLIADTNKNFPLTCANAKLALTPPSGMIFDEVAGQNIEGADIIFRFPDGAQYVREVKCIIGGRNSFISGLKQAAHQVEISGGIGDVFIQVHGEYAVQEAVEMFRLYRRNHPESLEKYRRVRVQVKDETGKTLFDGMLMGEEK